MSLGASGGASCWPAPGSACCSVPASTDATNRAINASYGEVTGITQTVRNYGSALGLAVLGTVLGNVFTARLTTSFESFGIPPEQAAGSAAAAAAGGGGSEASMAGVPAAMTERINAAVAADFAVATRAVLIGMAIALGISLLIALLHPGGRVLVERIEEDPTDAGNNMGAANAKDAANQNSTEANVPTCSKPDPVVGPAGRQVVVR